MEKDIKSKLTKIYLLLLMTTLCGSAQLIAQFDYWNTMEKQYGVAAVEDAKQGKRSLTMFNNDRNYIVTYTGSYVDMTVPNTVAYDYLRLEVRGADGGSRINTALITPFKTKGGGGALIKGYLKIGTGENEVPPGSTVRMIIGLSGGTYNEAGYLLAAGGGGTGLFVRKPNESSWETIIVAGGGGGAYSDCCTVQVEGQSASTTTSGKNGGPGSIGGENGSDSDKGGGGLNSAMENGEPKGSWAIWQDDLQFLFGGEKKDYFGCGHGQKQGLTKGLAGGGGGYSGGGAGSGISGGGGGGSYSNGLWVFFNEITILPNTNAPMAGYVIFQLTDNAPDATTIHFAYNSSKCIDAYRSNIDNGTNIQTYNCTGNSNQKWYLNTGDRTIHSMINFNKCLDLDHSNTGNGTNIQLWDCNNTEAQRWVYNGLYKTIHSTLNCDKCFDAANGSASTANVNLQLWDCQYTNNNQKWEIDGATAVSNVSNMKHIVPVLSTSFALHSHTGAVSGSNIQLWTKDNTNTAEQWYFDGMAIKMRDHQNLCIDLSQSVNIQLYNCNGTNAQKWLYDGMTKAIRSVVNTDKCMQIELNTDGVYGKRSNVDIQDCNGSEAQQFLIQE
ncbi:MAG: RICIN domain-containing protein [Saprospiraceae bacterium]